MGTAHPVVVLSRSAQDNAALAAQLRTRGLGVVELPTASFVDLPVLPEQLRELRRDLAALAFTSPHGVAAWQRALQAADATGSACVQAATGLDWRSLPCAAVGHKTAAALQADGWQVRWTATEEETGTQLARVLATALPPHSRVAIPQAQHARPELVAGLAAAGHTPLAVVVYKNQPPQPDPAALLRALDADLVYAAAPSAVDRLLDWLPALAAKRWVAIGPTTAAQLAARSPATRVAVAAQPTQHAVFAAIVAAAGVPA